MIIYQVIYYNQFGERVADFGYYEDKLDAEERAFEIRMKTSIESGKVCIEDIYVHDRTTYEYTNQDENKDTEIKEYEEEGKCIYIYDLKSEEGE